jgi:hypothetical protein
MSKGGSDAPSEVTNVTSSLPEYAQPYYESLLGRTSYESVRPYQTYTGQRLSDFNPYELNAMNQAANYGGPSVLDTAGIPDLLQRSTQANPYQDEMLQGVQDFPTSSFDPGTLEYNPLTGYMDPYQQAVTDIRKRETTRGSEIQGEGIADAATAAGGLGGYREAIMQSERQRNLNQQLDDIQNQGSADAFLRAREAFEMDKSREYQAADMATRQASEMANLGIGAYGAIGQDMARQQGSIGALTGAAATEQQLYFDRLRAMQSAGAQQRALQQASLDTGYQDFLRQQAYPREQLNFYSSMLQGVPVQPGQTSSVYGTGPSSLQQLIGTGIGGLGLYNALSGDGTT